MKKLLGFMLTLALVSLPALADDHTMVKPAANDVQLGTMHALNNVYLMKDGERMALCGCGKEFAVTDEKLSIDAHGMTMYCCTPECHDHAMKATPEEMAVGMADWQKLFAAKEMQTNWTMKDGKKMATCACGQTFEMTAKTPCVVENGVMVGACCEGCAERVMAAKPEERTAMMKKMLTTASMEVKH